MAIFSTLGALAERPPPVATKFALTLGHTRPGLGAATYGRVDVEPFHGGKRRDSDGAWWEILAENYVSVTQFGALGDGVRNDAPAIQAAIDFSLYVDRAPKKVVLPALPFRVDDTIHVGYGEKFVTIEIAGEPGAMAHGEAGLFPAFNDRPCLNVQGGRYVRLRNLCFFGVNREYLVRNYDGFDDRGQRETWLGPKLAAASASRNAPYAGLTIDAYAGPPPETAYPPVAYPAFLHENRQYGRNFSSNTIIEDCRIEGFYVALAVQPGLAPDASNGDFVTVRDCDFSFNVIGIADGHTDARCNNVENTRLHFHHTAIDTLSHGPGKGQFFGPVTGSSFDNVWRILNVNLGGSQTQGAYPLRFVGCYGESVYHLGSAYASGSHAPGLAFESCKFEFSIKNKEYSPRALLHCEAGGVDFRNCALMGGNGFAVFDADVRLDGVTFNHPQAVIFDAHTDSGRLAQSFTGEFWARGSRGVRVSPLSFFDFSGRSLEFAAREGLDGAAFDIARDAGAPGRPLPWWVQHLFDGETVFPIPRAPSLVLDREQHPVEIGGVEGAQYQLRLPGDWLAGLLGRGSKIDFLFGPGDFLFDAEAGIAAHVVEVSSSSPDEAQLKVRQLNGVRTHDFGKSWQIASPMRGDRGLLTFHNARRFYPSARRTAIETQKGERSARLSPGSDAGSAPTPLFPRPGDYISSDTGKSNPHQRLFPLAAITEIDANKGAATFDAAAAHSFWGDTPLFVKGGSR